MFREIRTREKITDTTVTTNSTNYKTTFDPDKRIVPGTTVTTNNTNYKTTFDPDKRIVPKN